MKKQAVILAAGRGVRMKRLTIDTPKPLVNVNGKPFLYYFLKNLERAGYTKVFLVVGYKKERLFDFLKKNGFQFDIVIVEQKEALGTGHAVLMTKPHIKENFVVINGDNLFSERDLKNINFSDDFNYLYGLEHEHPEKFGVLKTCGEFLVDIQEKPAKPETNLINTGLYKFTPEIFNALEKIEKSPRGEYELTSAVSLLVKKRKVKVKTLKDYYVHLGIFEDVPKVEEFIRKNLKCAE